MVGGGGGSKTLQEIGLPMFFLQHGRVDHTIVTQGNEIVPESFRGREITRINVSSRREQFGVICPSPDHRDDVEIIVDIKCFLRDVVGAEGVLKRQIEPARESERKLTLLMYYCR